MLSDLRNALWIELRKAARSRMPFFTTIGFLILPLACAFLMVVYKYPDFALNSGMVRTKANLAGGHADWPFYLSMFTQGIAGGGLLLFSLVESWVFGREFADSTIKDLLAVPVSRAAILMAKFIVAALWSAGMVMLTYLVCLGLGVAIDLPLGSSTVLWQGSLAVAITAILVIIVVMPAAFFASLGRGYLLPMSFTLLILALANIVALLGWGGYFPWAVPVIYAGSTAGRSAALEPASFWIVCFAGLAGLAATILWWQHADQSR